MQDKRDDKRDQTEVQVNPVGQDSPKSEYGKIGDEQSTTSGAEPPRSLGTKGTEFGQMADYDRSGQQGPSGSGQSDLSSQAGSTLSGHTDQQELGELGGDIDRPGNTGGATGKGFILGGDQEAEGAREDVETGQSRSGKSNIERP